VTALTHVKVHLRNVAILKFSEPGGPMAAAFDPLANRLLAAMPAADLRRWRPLLAPVKLRLGQVLQEPGRIPPFAYFPTTATVSLLYLSEDGACDEIAVVGREGMVGASLYMDGESTLGRAQVQGPGEALMVPGHVLKDEFERFTPVMHVLLRYLLARSAQIAQTSVCNRHHPVEQRLCRRLLQGLDRQPNGELLMTHEQLGGLLGVRRESVTAAALRLQQRGLLHYVRGHIAVLDRAGLERHACQCNSVIDKEYRRLLPASMAASGAAVLEAV